MGKKTVVENGIKTLLALIMNDKSAKSCSQVNLYFVYVRKQMWLKEYFFTNDINLKN